MKIAPNHTSQAEKVIYQSLRQITQPKDAIVLDELDFSFQRKESKSLFTWMTPMKCSHFCLAYGGQVSGYGLTSALLKEYQWTHQQYDIFYISKLVTIRF